jgi:hypothetical protein
MRHCRVVSPGCLAHPQHACQQICAAAATAAEAAAAAAAAPGDRAEQRAPDSADLSVVFEAAASHACIRRSARRKAVGGRQPSPHCTVVMGSHTEQWTKHVFAIMRTRRTSLRQAPSVLRQRQNTSHGGPPHQNEPVQTGCRCGCGSLMNDSLRCFVSMCGINHELNIAATARFAC